MKKKIRQVRGTMHIFIIYLRKSSYFKFSQSCSSTALDRTWCKCRQQFSPLATPFAESYTMQFLSLGVRYRQRLCTTIVHVHPGTFWSDNTCTADHYSRHATPSLGWGWLPCGYVSCNPKWTHWRTVINTWGTWTIAAADSCVVPV
jgi:hypothetical protein